MGTDVRGQHVHCMKQLSDWWQEMSWAHPEENTMFSNPPRRYKHNRDKKLDQTDWSLAPGHSSSGGSTAHTYQSTCFWWNLKHPSVCSISIWSHALHLISFTTITEPACGNVFPQAGCHLPLQKLSSGLNIVDIVKQLHILTKQQQTNRTNQTVNRRLVLWNTCQKWIPVDEQQAEERCLL